MIQKYTFMDNLKNIVQSTFKECHFRVHNVFNLSKFPSWHIPERKIQDWMIVYARGGKGFYKIDHVEYPIEEGKIFFISHDITHSAAQIEAYPVSVIAIRFSLYDNFTNNSNIQTFMPFSFCYQLSKSSYFHQIFENINSYFKLYPENISNGLCNTLLCEIFNQLYLKVAEEHSYDTIDKKMGLAKMFIEENILSDVSIQKVSDYVGLSPKYFSKQFKKQFQITYKKYLFEAKMHYAKYILEEGCYPVKDVAFLLGYSDPYIFSNQFKKFLGKAPSKIKRPK